MTTQIPYGPAHADYPQHRAEYPQQAEYPQHVAEYPQFAAGHAQYPPAEHYAPHAAPNTAAGHPSPHAPESYHHVPPQPTHYNPPQAASYSSPQPTDYGAPRAAGSSPSQAAGYSPSQAAGYSPSQAAGYSPSQAAGYSAAGYSAPQPANYSPPQAANYGPPQQAAAAPGYAPTAPGYAAAPTPPGYGTPSPAATYPPPAAYPTAPPWAPQETPAPPVEPAAPAGVPVVGGLLVPYPEEMQHAPSAQAPAFWPVAVFTFLFSIFGAISAARRADQARRGRNSTSPYWVTFAVTLVAGGFFWFAGGAAVGVPAYLAYRDGAIVKQLEDNVVSDGQLAKANVSADEADCRAASDWRTDGTRDYLCQLTLSDGRTGQVTVTADQEGDWKPLSRR